MNQILVTDKVFITPEFKRKKKAYKLNFILSIIAVSLLSTYCIYAAYDRGTNRYLINNEKRR